MRNTSYFDHSATVSKIYDVLKAKVDDLTEDQRNFIINKSFNDYKNFQTSDYETLSTKLAAQGTESRYYSKLTSIINCKKKNENNLFNNGVIELLGVYLNDLCNRYKQNGKIPKAKEIIEIATAKELFLYLFIEALICKTNSSSSANNYELNRLRVSQQKELHKLVDAFKSTKEEFNDKLKEINENFSSLNAKLDNIIACIFARDQEIDQKLKDH